MGDRDHILLFLAGVNILLGVHSIAQVYARQAVRHQELANRRVIRDQMRAHLVEYHPDPKPHVVGDADSEAPEVAGE